MYQESIRDIYEHLSPGYRRIADFLLKSYQQAAFMTAAEVGRASDVDTTLVVRFAQRLGYPGFPELIADIQDDVKRDLRAVYEPVGDDSSGLGILRRNLTQDRNNLEYMLLHLDEETFQKVVDILAKASRIYITGEGNAIYIGEALATRFTTLGYDAHIVPSEPAGQAAIAALLKPTDAVIGLGTSLMSPSVAALLKVARKAGTPTIGIVGSYTNPAAAAAQYTILAPSLTSGIMPSWTAIAAAAHALSQAVAGVRGEPTTDWAMRTDQMLKNYGEAWRTVAANVRESVADYNLPPSS
jgi:DNA-binding MurR/RpiR family transcriptional regulator